MSEDIKDLLDRVDEQRTEIEGMKKVLERENQRRLARVWTSETEYTIVNAERPGVLLQFNREFNKEYPETNHEIAWIVWAGSGKPGSNKYDPEKAFEEWVEKIYEIEWIWAERGKAVSQTLPG